MSHSSYDENCIFCKIASGEIPSFCLYEDDTFKIILDRYPSTVGHTLVLVKEHKENIFKLDENQCAKLYPIVQKCAAALKETLGCQGINILQNNGEVAGQTVNHFHVHIIPRNENDGIIMKWTENDPSAEDFKKVIDNIKL